MGTMQQQVEMPIASLKSEPPTSGFSDHGTDSGTRDELSFPWKSLA
jgi:hypothetical protein